MEYHHPFRSFLRRSVNRIRYGKRLGPLIGTLQQADDYDWTKYTEDSYKHEMERNSTIGRLEDVDWTISDSKIRVAANAELHPMHRIIYETALWLKPESAFEAGCGGGDHLANLQILMPDLKLAGCDVSIEQLAFARERNFAENSVSLHRMDLTKPGVAGEIKADFVYTNAVLMHIHGGDRPLQFVKNLWSISSRYLLFVENWARHDYLKLFDEATKGRPAYKVERNGTVGVLLTREDSMNLPVLTSRTDL